MNEIERRKNESKAGFIPTVAECDLCRRELDAGEGYHELTVGMNDTPYYVEGLSEDEPTVEDTSELTVCERCEPAVSAAVDQLLATLWALRAKDTTGDEEDEPTVRMAASNPSVDMTGACERIDAELRTTDFTGSQLRAEMARAGLPADSVIDTIVTEYTPSGQTMAALGWVPETPKERGES